MTYVDIETMDRLRQGELYHHFSPVSPAETDHIFEYRFVEWTCDLFLLKQVSNDVSGYMIYIYRKTLRGIGKNLVSCNCSFESMQFWVTKVGPHQTLRVTWFPN